MPCTTGGIGTPDFTEQLKNIGITSAAATALAFLFVRDLRGQLRDDQAIKREEALGRLQVTPA